MKTFIIIVICVFPYWTNLYSQVIPSDFKFLVEFPISYENKHKIPHEILIDSAGEYLIIRYDFKPSYLEFYKIKDFTFVNRIKIKGWVNLWDSFFDKNNRNIYISQGFRGKYIKIDLNSFVQSKVRSDQLPSNPFIILSEDKDTLSYDNEKMAIRHSGWFIIRSNNKKMEIYLQQGHFTNIN